MEAYAAPRAAGRSRLALIVAVLIFALGVPATHCIGGAISGWRAIDDAMTGAADYDAHFDPIVIEGGQVSAGPRIVHLVEDDETILVDPDETVPDEAIVTTEAVIVRRTEVVRRERFREQRYPVSELQAFVGTDTITIDSAHLQGWLESNRGMIVAAMAAFFGLATPFDWVLLGGAAAIGARIGAAMAGDRGRWREALAPGLLLATALVPVKWGAWAVGLPLVGCAGLAVWLPLALFGAALGGLVLARRS